jgi:hypothetical protein
MIGPWLLAEAAEQQSVSGGTHSAPPDQLINARTSLTLSNPGSQRA